MIKLPVTDDDDFPIQKRGVSAFPGLFFVGLPWLHTAKSGLIFGVSDDARYIADRIAARRDERVDWRGPAPAPQRRIPARAKKPRATTSRRRRWSITSLRLRASSIWT
jgi:putative flavoprotein involved in K+ transport